MLDNVPSGTFLPRPYSWQRPSFLAEKLAKLGIEVPYTAQSLYSELIHAAVQITELGSRALRTLTANYDINENAFVIDSQSMWHQKTYLAKGMSESNNRIDEYVLSEAMGPLAQCHVKLKESNAGLKLQIATEWWRCASQTKEGWHDINEVQDMLGKEYPIIGLSGKEEALLLGLAACRWFDKEMRHSQFKPGTLVAIGNGSFEFLNFVRTHAKHDHEVQIDYESCTALRAGEAPLIAHTGGDPDKVQEFINKKLDKSSWQPISGKNLYVTSSGLTQACKTTGLIEEDHKHKIDVIELNDKHRRIKMEQRLALDIKGNFSHRPASKQPQTKEEITTTRYASAALRTVYEIMKPERIILLPVHNCSPRVGSPIDLGLA